MIARAHRVSRFYFRRFTLVELMTAMAVFSILLLLMTMSIRGIQNFWVAAARKIEVVDNGRRILELIEADIAGLKTSDVPGEKILVDGQGIGARDVAFLSTGSPVVGATAPLYEVGYSVDDHRFLRWTTADADGSPWDFLNQDPELWAADNSWGSAKSVLDGVVDFQLVFYKSIETPPFYAIYNTISDSDQTPAFASVSLTLIHPDTMNASAAEQNRFRQSFTTRLRPLQP